MNFRRTLPEIRCLSPVCPPVRYVPFLARLSSSRRAGGNIISPMLRMGMLCGALGCLLAWVPLRAADVALPPAAKTKIEFARDIEPLLAKRCLVCHGAQQQMSGLRLDQKEAALKGGKAGVDILPGKSAESRLIRLVAGLDRKFMPPMGAHLTAEEVGLLRAWIDQGLEWTARAPHWSFQKIQRPALPAVRDRDWGRNPVDNFILARLEHEGIAPSPEAPKLTLLRRVSLDLTGLPPTPEQVREYLSDNRPDAYERLVDRLLDSPHYGEKWARYWLDLARYADSDGYEKDRSRPWAWRYRHWVIDALNRDMPFDRVHHPTARRRSAAQSQSRHPGRHRIQSQHPHQSRRRHRSRTVPRRAGAGPRGHARHRVDGPHRGLRAVPQPQVRPHQPERVLPAHGVFQYSGRSRISRRRYRANSAPTSPPSPSTTASARRCSTSTRSPRIWRTTNPSCAKPHSTPASTTIGISLTARSRTP